MRLPIVLFPDPLLPTMNVSWPAEKEKDDLLRTTFVGLEGYAKVTCIESLLAVAIENKEKLDDTYIYQVNIPNTSSRLRPTTVFIDSCFVFLIQYG